MKINEQLKLVLLVVLAVIGSMLIYYNTTVKEKTKYTEDEIKFKEEYESLNGEHDDARDRDYLEVKIPGNNNVKYTSYEEIFNIFEKEESAVIYFGFKECPWCRNAIPALIDAASDYGVENVLYLDNQTDRDTMHLTEEGTLITDKEASADYKKLVEILYDVLPNYNGLNDDTVKRLYYPTVLFINEGKVVGLHTSTVDSHTDSKVPMNDTQKEELKKIYTDYLKLAFKDTCDESC